MAAISLISGRAFFKRSSFSDHEWRIHPDVWPRRQERQGQQRHRDPHGGREDGARRGEEHGQGRPRPHQLRLSPHVQHGAESAQSGGDQPGVHDGEELSPIPKLFTSPQFVQK